MVQETSLKAYIEEKENFISQEQNVYEYIKNNPKCTDRDISQALKLEINSVNGRRNALFKKNKIMSMGKLKSTYTNKMVMCWGAI